MPNGKANDMARFSDEWGFFPKDRGLEHRCFECGVITTGRHHVVPVSLGGTKQLPLCMDCHDKAHTGQTLSRLISEGIERKRQAGWQPGRPRKLTPELYTKITELRLQGRTMKAIAKSLGISVGTVCNALNPLSGL